MNIIRHQTPVNSFSNLFDSFFDDFFQKESVSEIKSKTDVLETDKAYELQMALPGFEKKDITLEVINGYLKISGERKFEEKKEATYHRLETYYGSFERKFKLPGSINDEKIDAEFKNGILFVSLPKHKESILKRLISIK